MSDLALSPLTWLLVAFAIRRRPAATDVDFTDVELEAELQAVLAE